MPLPPRSSRARRSVSRRSSKCPACLRLPSWRAVASPRQPTRLEHHSIVPVYCEQHGNEREFAIAVRVLSIQALVQPVCANLPACRLGPHARDLFSRVSILVSLLLLLPVVARLNGLYQRSVGHLQKPTRRA